MKDFLSLFPVRDPEPFKEKHDSSAGAKPNMAWTHISDISHDKRRVMHDKIANLRKKKSIRIRDQGKRHSRSQSAFGLGLDGKNKAAAQKTMVGKKTKVSTTPGRGTETQLLATTISQQLNQKNQRNGGTPVKGRPKERGSPSDSFDETFRNHHSRHPQHHMKRKQSAREKLNDYHSAGRNGAPRSTIIAGKRIKVRKWDEAFWKHAAEDPQLR